MGEMWKVHFDKKIDAHSGMAEKATSKAEKGCLRLLQRSVFRGKTKEWTCRGGKRDMLRYFVSCKYF